MSNKKNSTISNEKQFMKIFIYLLGITKISQEEFCQKNQYDESICKKAAFYEWKNGHYVPKTDEKIEKIADLFYNKIKDNKDKFDEFKAFVMENYPALNLEVEQLTNTKDAVEERKRKKNSKYRFLYFTLKKAAEASRIEAIDEKIETVNQKIIEFNKNSFIKSIVDRIYKFIIIIVCISFILTLYLFTRRRDSSISGTSKNTSMTSSKTMEPTNSITTIYIVNTKNEIEESTIKNMFNDNKEPFKIEVTNEDSDADPLTRKDTYTAKLNKNEPTIYILDKVDLDTHKREFETINLDNIKVDLRPDEEIRDNDNNIKGLPFIREAFSVVLKKDKNLPSSVSNLEKNCNLKDFENIITKENLLFMLKQKWASSSHIFSIAQINALGPNRFSSSANLFNAMLTKNSNNEYEHSNTYESFLDVFAKTPNARFCFTGTWVEPILKNASPNTEFSFIPLPLQNQNDKIIAGATKYIAIKKTDEKTKDLALKFIKDVVEYDLLKKIGLVCALKKPNIKEWDKNKYPLIYSMLQYLQENKTYPYTPITRTHREKLDGCIEQAFSNPNDPKLKIDENTVKDCLK